MTFNQHAGPHDTRAALKVAIPIAVGDYCRQGCARAVVVWYEQTAGSRRHLQSCKEVTTDPSARRAGSPLGRSHSKRGAAESAQGSEDVLALGQSLYHRVGKAVTLSPRHGYLYLDKSAGIRNRQRAQEERVLDAEDGSIGPIPKATDSIALDVKL